MGVRKYTFDDIKSHRSTDSCWVVLYGNVYDVTPFLPSHPGGSKIILELSGSDATEEYDPIHPPGTLEDNLPPEAKLGPFDATTLPKPEATAPSPAQASAGQQQQQQQQSDDGIDSLADCLNLDDVERLATKRLSRKAWGYYFSASDDLRSKQLNNAVYGSILLRPRVFVDCTRCSLATTLLATAANTTTTTNTTAASNSLQLRSASTDSSLSVAVPFFVSPAAMARLAHPAGEAGIAAACARFGALQLISNNASQAPEQIVAGAPRGQVFGWQLYVQNSRAKSEAMLARIGQLAAVKLVVLTLDAPVPGKREDDERSHKVGGRLPAPSAVAAGGAAEKQALPEAGGDGAEGPGGGVGKALFAGTAADLTWRETLAWLERHTDRPIVLKGVQTHEDAYIAAQFAPRVRGIVLSNHGGRAMDTAPPAVHTLLEIRKYCPEVFETVDVWVDGGIRRGTDVVKALALGAKAVGVGRAPLYGLGAGGQEGVEKVLQILQHETETAMRLLGVEKVEELGLQHVNTRAVERDLYDGAPAMRELGKWVKSRL